MTLYVVFAPERGVLYEAKSRSIPQKMIFQVPHKMGPGPFYMILEFLFGFHRYFFIATRFSAWFLCPSSPVRTLVRSGVQEYDSYG
jgi:hypothetical protein